MSLSPGHKLAHYEILEPIGRGGMGEVYRARDGKLGRDVAIKVLPEELAKNEERLARFKREAKVLASLNHPNIASIYGLEQSDGTHYLVLELVPGETLAERISRGPIPLEEALDIATQMADALEEAHEQGIVHRDLKPANVKQTEDGKIKVLDFGLAKAFVDEAAEADSSMSPTLTRDATRVGVILGTAAYMSPEQAKGKKVDKRTDIFAFGAVLYEMLTGKKAFPGEDVSEVLASVIKLEPDWSATPPDLDPRIPNILRRCLRKELKKRLRDIGDARNEIDEIIAAPSAASAQQPLTASVSTRSRERVAWGLAVLIAVLVASVAVWTVTPPEPRPPTRFALALPATDQLDSAVALSPDGRELVYVARRDGVRRLYRRSMGGLEAATIRATEGAEYPFFSPDGEWVGFFADAKLKKVPLAGGTPVTLCDAEYRVGASWGEDDVIVFASRATPTLMKVSASGGAPQPITVVDSEERRHSWPHILPGGKAVLFTALTNNTANAQIVVQSLETGEKRALVDGLHARYAPTGHIVFGRQSAQSLWAVPFDLNRLEVTGEPRPVLEGVQVNPGGLTNFAIASAGTLVYIPSGLLTATLGGALLWVDRQGVEQRLAEDWRGYRSPRLSPDDQHLAVTIMEDNLARDVWVFALGRGTLTRLTFGGQNQRPVWSVDGEQVIFASERGEEDAHSIFRKPARGSGTTEQVTSGADRYPTSVSSDVKTIVFTQLSDSTGADIGVVHLEGEGEREPEMLLQTSFAEHSGMLSPDDRWLAFVSDESGREEVYVRPFPGLDGKWQISTEGGTQPMWSRDGKELFFRNGDRMMAVAISTEPELVLKQAYSQTTRSICKL